MEGEGGNFRVKGLPQHGYPYAVAITNVRVGVETDRKVRVLRVDPRTVRAANAGVDAGASADADAGASTDADGGAGASASANVGALVAVFARPARATATATATAPSEKRKRGATPMVSAAPAPPPTPDGKKLWLGAHVFAIEKNAPRGAIAIADVATSGVPGFGMSRAAVGISDEDGMLQWVELMPDDKPDARSGEQMLKLLERLGCSTRALVLGDVTAFLGGALDIGALPAVPGLPVARLLRTTAPGARPYFESVEVVPQSVWSPLQAQRVKWRPTLAPPDKPAASGSAAPSSSPPLPK
jgi:hypothetical protein